MTTSRRTAVTVVHTPACHFCEDAEEKLAELAAEFPLEIQLIDAAGSQGAALVREHGAGMFPLVLLDGEFFSVGRLPRRKLRKLLADRAGAVA